MPYIVNLILIFEPLQLKMLLPNSSITYNNNFNTKCLNYLPNEVSTKHTENMAELKNLKCSEDIK